MAELRKTHFKIDGRRFTLTGEIDEPEPATAAQMKPSEQATSPTPPDSPATPKTAKERNSELYKRRREEGWRKDWICPSLDAAGREAGGLDKLAADYLRARTDLTRLEAEVVRIKGRSLIERILNRNL